MRKIYAIEIIERDGEGEKVVFTKVLPGISITPAIKTRKGLEDRARRSKQLRQHEKTATLNGISFTLDIWFPNHFYRITKVDWKYD